MTFFKKPPQLSLPATHPNPQEPRTNLFNVRSSDAYYCMGRMVQLRTSLCEILVYIESFHEGCLS